MAVLTEALKFSSSSSVPAIFPKKSRAHHQPRFDWGGASRKEDQKSSKGKEGLLVGPADRYNLGGLLTPHVLARALELSKVRCAGLVRAEQTEVGGFPVRNYGERALEMGGTDLHLIHFGGSSVSENLIDAYAAATDGEEAERFESLRLIGDEQAISSYVRRRTGQLDDFAYLLAPEGEFFGCRTSFHSVGIPSPELMSTAAVEKLVDVMKHSDFVGVQDLASTEFLKRSGVNVEQMPSALSVLPQVCARQLQESRNNPAVEEIRHRFPNGWLAVEVGDVHDRHFDRLGRSLKAVAAREGLGLVFFDGSGSNASPVRRWVEAHPEWEAAEFSSSNIWDVSSLILQSRLYCGSCLDSRVIAMAGAVPRIGVPTADSTTRDYCELWELEKLAVELQETEDWDAGLSQAMQVDFKALEGHARNLGERYFSALRKFAEATGIGLNRAF